MDETGKVIVEAMSSGASATDAMGMSLERAIDSYGRLGSAAQAAAEKALAAKEKELEMTERLMDAKQKEIDLENRRLGRDREGFSTDKNGNRTEQMVQTWMSTMDQLKSWGLDEVTSKGIADELFTSDGKMKSLNGFRKEKSDTFSSILRRMAEEELRNTPLNTAGNSAGGGRTQGGSGSQSGSGSSSANAVTITFKTASGAQSSVVTSPGTTVEDVINTLRSAGASSIQRSN